MDLDFNEKIFCDIKDVFYKEIKGEYVVRIDNVVSSLNKDLGGYIPTKVLIVASSNYKHERGQQYIFHFTRDRFISQWNSMSRPSLNKNDSILLYIEKKKYLCITKIEKIKVAL